MLSPDSVTILLIDDSRTNLAVYQTILRQLSGAVCVPYESPENALAWASENEPDLVLVDFQMPGIDGHEFIRRFRLLPGRGLTPIVMITASQEKSVRHTALELGATDFLNKPADPVEFIARARNLLALRAGQKKLADRAVHLADEVRKATAALAERERESILQLLCVAEFRDKDTASHIIRIGQLAAVLARVVGEPAERVEMISLAAPMHDIGKVSTPYTILLKRGKLTPEEWVIMRAHTTAGYEILGKSKSELLRAGADIALTHHEKFDGSGYPRGIKGREIPLWGRITALVDVFDALTSERPYKKAWPTSEALERIKADSGSHFDPDLVEAFLSALPEVTAVRVRYPDERVA
jgi:putative two-component system response regulator